MIKLFTIEIKRLLNKLINNRWFSKSQTQLFRIFEHHVVHGFFDDRFRKHSLEKT